MAVELSDVSEHACVAHGSHLCCVLHILVEAYDTKHDLVTAPMPNMIVGRQQNTAVQPACLHSLVVVATTYQPFLQAQLKPTRTWMVDRNCDWRIARCSCVSPTVSWVLAGWATVKETLGTIPEIRN